MAKKPRLMLVEDDKAIRDMLSSLLKIEGYEVVVAANGQEALKELESPILPSAILLDMMMPHSNGWELLDSLKSNSATAKIPVIVVSAYEEVCGEVAKSLKPEGFIPKPVQLKTLLETIEKWVS